MKELARGVDAVLPRRYSAILAFSCDVQRYVPVSSGNGIPSEVYVGVRRTGHLRLVMPLYPELTGKSTLGESAIEFTARERQPIRGYLALQKGEPPAQGWPPGADAPWRTVLGRQPGLCPRDGVVGSPRLRCAAGELPRLDLGGGSFLRAGFKKWSLEMQDDLTDGVHWAIEQRHVDPRRICIAGASFGGYAALMAR